MEMCGFIPYECDNYEVCKSYVGVSGCRVCKRGE